MAKYIYPADQYKIEVETNLQRIYFGDPKGIEQIIKVAITDKVHDRTHITEKCEQVYKIPSTIKKVLFNAENEFLGFIDLKSEVKQMVKKTMTKHNKDLLTELQTKFNEQNPSDTLREAVNEAVSELELDK